MDMIYFAVRHTPFWAVPLLYIGVQFFYIYWVRDFKRTSYGFLLLGLASFAALLFYYFTGGTEHSVQYLQQLIEMWFS